MQIPASIPRRAPRLHIAAAVPIFFVAAWFALCATSFLEGSDRAGERMAALAAWPFYEILASGFGIVLPLAVATGDALIAEVGAVPSRRRRLIVTAALLSPLLLLVLVSCHQKESGMALLFLVAAFAHWAAFERGASEHTIASHEDHPPSPLVRAALSFVKCYGLGMIALLTSILIVVLPPELFGNKLTEESEMDFGLVAIGAIYFALLGVANLLNVEGRCERWLARTRAEGAQDAARILGSGADPAP